jgi:hypothetical protein
MKQPSEVMSKNIEAAESLFYTKSKKKGNVANYSSIFPNQSSLSFA